MWGDSSLTKMRMFFTNGVTSRAYQSTGSNVRDYTRELNIKQKIKKIALRLRSADNLIWGVTLTESNGEEVAKWENEHQGDRRVAQEIPDGYEIIGMYGNDSGDRITSLGFILWTPNPVAFP